MWSHLNGQLKSSIILSFKINSMKVLGKGFLNFTTNLDRIRHPEGESGAELLSRVLLLLPLRYDGHQLCGFPPHGPLALHEERP